MKPWLVAFLVTAAGAVFAPLASKVASRTAGPLYASVIESAATFVVVAAVAGGALSLRATPVPWSAWGWPALAGALWSLFVMGIYYTFALGAPAGTAMAVLRAIAIGGTTLAAVALLGEALSARQWLGVGVIIVGVWLVSA